MITETNLHKQELEGILRPNGAIFAPADYPYNLIYFGAPGSGKSM